jgi:hypothetical protein
MDHDADSRRQTPVDEPQAESADDGWLSRWSQRKREAKDPKQAPRAASVDTTPAAGGDAGRDTPDEAPPLPSIESLDEHSDYRGFMSDRVSDELRLQALRKLFRLPQFNITDGLNDYDEDFANCKPLGDTITHDMVRSLERTLKRAADPEKQADTATAASEEAAQTPPAAETTGPDAEAANPANPAQAARSDGPLPKG